MSEPCAIIPTSPLPRILPGESAPDYTQPLLYIGSRLAAIEALLQAQRTQDMNIYPQHGDEDEYYGNSVVAVAGATTIVTWNLQKDYIYFFRKIYIDSDLDNTYTWTFEATTEKTGAKVLIGSEHDFDGQPIKAKGNTKLTLEITNAGASNTTLDIMIQSWSRKL